MKSFIIFCFIFLTYSSNSLVSQETIESKSKNIDKFALTADSASHKNNCKDSLCKQNGKNCDKNGKQKKENRKSDRFIDSDKDGLNDNRCKGMGFGGKKRAGKCCGKNK